MIIALESASSDPSLALASVDGSAVAVDGWAGEGRQASELLPRLLALLERAGRELHEATGVGGRRRSRLLYRPARLDEPGQGARARSGCPAWWASRAWRPGSHRPPTLPRQPFVPARRTHSCWCVASPSHAIVPASELSAITGGSRVAAPSELAAAFRLANAVPPHAAAAAVARMTAARLADDPGGDELAGLEPWYLRPPRGVGSPAEVTTWP